VCVFVWGVCVCVGVCVCLCGCVCVCVSNFKILAGDPLLQHFHALQIISCEPHVLPQLSY